MEDIKTKVLKKHEEHRDMSIAKLIWALWLFRTLGSPTQWTNLMVFKMTSTQLLKLCWLRSGLHSYWERSDWIRKSSISSRFFGISGLSEFWLQGRTTITFKILLLTSAKKLLIETLMKPQSCLFGEKRISVSRKIKIICAFWHSDNVEVAEGVVPKKKHFRNTYVLLRFQRTQGGKKTDCKK